VKITDVKVWSYEAVADNGNATCGSTVTYLRDGAPSSARLPFAATPAEAQRWIEEANKRLSKSLNRG
jgi:hypothetical protein